MPNRRHILFATYAGQPDITDDDRLLADALARRELVVRGARWDDASAEWGRAVSVIVRSTWDYHRRRDEFLEWTERVAAQTALYNTPPVIRWNSHKSYIAELGARGIPVIDTVFAKAGSCTDVAALATTHRWHDIVIKPAVSASAYETAFFSAGDREASQAHLDRLLAMGDAMLQPHLATLAEQGELSLLFGDGQFTHAVRRRSALSSDGRLPRSAATAANPDAVRFAERVLREAGALTRPGEVPLYARVDLAEMAEGYQLLELELIEPSMFFLHAPHAADRVADALVSRL